MPAAGRRALSDTMSVRVPRAGTEAAKTRLVELVAQLVHRAPAERAAPRRPHPCGPASLNRANSRILLAVRAAGAAAWRRDLGLLLDGLRAERAYPPYTIPARRG